MKKIAVVNYDKSGRVTKGVWHVRTGNEWRTFTEAEWRADGLAWIAAQLADG